MGGMRKFVATWRPSSRSNGWSLHRTPSGKSIQGWDHKMALSASLGWGRFITRGERGFRLPAHLRHARTAGAGDDPGGTRTALPGREVDRAQNAVDANEPWEREIRRPCLRVSLHWATSRPTGSPCRWLWNNEPHKIRSQPWDSPGNWRELGSQFLLKARRTE